MILRVLLGLILLIPILGAFGVFPAPTADLYSDPNGWAFMSALIVTGYMMPLIGLTCALALVLLVMNRTALMAVILAPLTLNVILFHIFLNVTPVSLESSLGWALFLLNAYFLWLNRAKYKTLW